MTPLLALSTYNILCPFTMCTQTLEWKSVVRRSSASRQVRHVNVNSLPLPDVAPCHISLHNLLAPPIDTARSICPQCIVNGQCRVAHLSTRLCCPPILGFRREGGSSVSVESLNRSRICFDLLRLGAWTLLGS